VTTLLTRPTLQPLPARRPGALVAPHHDLRPCVTNPPQWWDTGNRRGNTALRLCGTCPWIDQCTPTNGDKPTGVIRAGVAYDDNGRPARLCKGCAAALNKATAHTTVHCDRCKRGRLVRHHTRIADLVEQGCSWAVIGRAVGYHGDTVRRYWVRHLNEQNQHQEKRA
jgi:hypothetical protein